MENLRQRFQEYRASKTALFWSCVGSIIVALVLGFTWGGWVTGGTAAEMAEQAAEDAQAELASAVCVKKFMAAADANMQLASLKEIDSSWNQENFVEDGGWAVIAGKEYDDAAELCAEKLTAMELTTTQEAADSNTGTVVQ